MINLSGKTFGCLTVIDFYGKEGKKNIFETVDVVVGIIVKLMVVH